MIARCLGLAAVFLLSSCSLEPGRSGAACRRSTECEEGLACVRERCSRDLGPIADESTVPDLGEGDAGAAAAGSGG